MDISVKEVEIESHWRKYASTVAESADRDRGLTPEIIMSSRLFVQLKIYIMINFKIYKIN
jgi:hypothetical protein